jgi:tetratricopeptide (TPR) repeat protein
MQRKTFNFILFVVYFAIFTARGHCLNIDKPKICFLKGEYKQAILEGEKLLAKETHKSGSDELYYILGMSYLKEGNYLRASDIFEIILKEFKESAFKDEAKLGLGDTYFLRGAYDKAKACYIALLDNNNRSELKPLLYYRLSQCAFKQGDVEKGNNYLSKLKNGFPLNLEASFNRGSDNSLDFYTVQIGSFTNSSNANNLSNKLISKGYDAYVQEADISGRKIYRVRVGRLKSRLDAVQIKNKLASEGYPANIIP